MDEIPFNSSGLVRTGVGERLVTQTFQFGKSPVDTGVDLESCLNRQVWIRGRVRKYWHKKCFFLALSAAWARSLSYFLLLLQFVLYQVASNCFCPKGAVILNLNECFRSCISPKATTVTPVVTTAPCSQRQREHGRESQVFTQWPWA